MNVERIAGRVHRPGPDAQAVPATPPRIVIFGDSHVHAIQEAIKAREAAGIPVAIEARRRLKTAGGVDPVRSTKAGARLFQTIIARLTGRGEASSSEEETGPARVVGDTPLNEFITIARSLGPNDLLVSAIRGNKHAVFSTIQHAEPFDFFFPEDRPKRTDGNVPLIPFRPLYEHFSEGLRLGDGMTLAALRKSTRAHMIHISSPPPKGAMAYIQRHHDTRFAADGITSLGVSKPRLRMKFWQMQNRALREICVELGIELLDPPEAACDAKGYLNHSFYARDATHANAAYGELVLDQLEQCAARLVSRASVS